MSRWSAVNGERDAAAKYDDLRCVLSCSPAQWAMQLSATCLLRGKACRDGKPGDWSAEVGLVDSATRSARDAKHGADDVVACDGLAHSCTVKVSSLDERKWLIPQ